MENLSLKVAQIVGSPTPGSWSWVYTFFPEEEEKREKRGVLLAALSLFRPETGEEDETPTLGREILLRLHEEYYGQIQTPVLEKLTQTVEKVCGEFSQGEQKLELSAAVLVGEVLYLAILGPGQVWLKREEKLAKILVGQAEKSENASGFLKAGDLLVIGTVSFFAGLGEGVLRAALESGEPQEAVEALTPLIHRQARASQVAALIGKTEAPQREKEVKEEVLPEPPEEEAVLLGQEASFVGRSRAVAGHFVRQILGKIPRFSLGAIYIRRQNEEQRSKKTLSTVAVILIFLFGISLFFGVKRKQESEKQRRFLTAHEEALTLLEQGKGLVTLNPLQSRQFFKQAETKVNEIKALKVEPEKTASLAQALTEAMSLVFKEYELTSVPVFLDLTLMAQDGWGDKFFLYRQYLGILDQGKNRVLGSEIERKTTEILVGGGTISSSRLIAVYANSAFVLEEEGLAEIDIRNKKTVRGKIKTDQVWGEIQAIWVYGGNLYLLDKGKNQVWRYSVAEEGFGARQKWLAQDAPFLGQAVSMAIDGSIWILSQEGKISKFTQGTPSAFGLSGLTKPLQSPTVLYTSDEAENLYVLDKGNKRIVVLAKTGEYQAEYLWEGLGQVSDMVVAESGKKIFLLAGSKIYEIGLR